MNGLTSDKLKCPKCEECSVTVAATCLLNLYDKKKYQSWDAHDFEWTSRSMCHCLNCDYVATVKDFTKVKKR